MDKKVTSKMVKNVFWIVAFIVALGVPIAFCNKIPNKVLQNENRYATSFPKIISEDGKVITENLKENLENWFNDNFGFRDVLMELYAKISVFIFRISPNKQVEIGKDGWYFYTSDHNIGIASGDYPLDEATMERIIYNQQNISDCLKKQGIQYVLSMTPSKVSVYPEMLKSGEYTVGETVIDRVYTTLQEKTDIDIINLKPLLLEEKVNNQVYYKTDTHWNAVGAYTGYCGIVNWFNEQEIIDSKCLSAEQYDTEYLGEFSRMMGAADLLGYEETVGFNLLNTKAVSVNSGELYERVSEWGNSVGAYLVAVYKNEEIQNGKTALVIANSMYGGGAIPQKLAEHFSDVVYVWTYHITQDIIDIVQPDIVLANYGERYLNFLADYNYSFGLISLSNPQAEIISVEMPEKIENETPVDIRITVRNTGTETWSEKDWIRVGLLVNNKDSGIRGCIEEGTSVLPGEEYVFVLNNVRMPVEWNDAYLEWTMLQESKFYFGERQWSSINSFSYDFESLIEEIRINQNAGSLCEINVWVKNISNFTWDEEKRIRLGLFNGENDIGIRAYILNSEIIEPGESYMFTFKDIATDKLDNLYAGMLFEGITYFGERKKVNDAEGKK